RRTLRTRQPGECRRRGAGWEGEGAASASARASGSDWPSACVAVTRSAPAARSADHRQPAAALSAGQAPDGSRQRGNREDELAELLATRHPFLRLSGLLQGKGSVDHRTERLRRQQRIQLFPIVSGAHGGSVDRDLLLEDAADILLRL